MPVATIKQSTGKKNMSLLAIAIVILVVVFSALAFIFLNRSQAPANPAAEPVNDSSAPSCPAESANCRWTVGPSADLSNPTLFLYEIRDLTTSQIIKSGKTTDLLITFTPISGHAYGCIVTPVNSCSQGAPAQTKAICSPNITPTVTPKIIITTSVSPTPTGALTPTVTPTGALTATPTPTISVTPSVTPTGTITPTITPTPTEIIIVKATNTPGPSAAPTSGVGPSATSVPVPPASGVIWPSVAILIGVSLIILLSLVF